jgi:hypothetical protein
MRYKVMLKDKESIFVEAEDVDLNCCSGMSRISANDDDEDDDRTITHECAVHYYNFLKTDPSDDDRLVTVAAIPYELVSYINKE